MVNLLLALTDIAMLSAAIYSGIYFSKLNKALKIFCFYILLSIVIQLPAQYLASKSINNLFLLHCLVPLSFIGLTYFYAQVFRGFIDRRVLFITMGCFVVLSILNSLFLQSIDTFNSFAMTLESVLVIILSLSLYILLLNESVRKEKRAQLQSLIWVNSGLFIYYTSGLLLFYFGELLTTFTPMKFRISWLFHSLIYLIMFICIIIGLWKYPKK